MNTAIGDRPATVADLVSAHATRDAVAFTHVEYGADRRPVATTLTWRELDVRVRAVAAEIQRSAAPGDRVAVLAPQDLDYVVAFLAATVAGTVAVPLFAPEAITHDTRLVGALADCAPAVWLTSGRAEAQATRLAEAHPALRPGRVLAVDRVDPAAAAAYVPAPLAPAGPAYLQYTSGSTRNPAGAVITHGAALANARQVAAAFDATRESTWVGWLPLFHDMGLVGTVLVPVLLGVHSVFTAPLTFIRRPASWLTLLASHPGAITAAPNFAFDLAVARVREADRAELDLRGVQVMVNSSEPVRPATIAAFDAAFGSCGLAPTAHRPAYGLAEATVLVATTPSGTAPLVTAFDRDALAAGKAVPPAPGTAAVTLVSVGRGAGQHVQVVDPETGAAAAETVVGELWVHGPNLASGYWGDPAHTATTFGAELLDPPAGLPRDGWLRTGDLGVAVAGELYVTGRIKDLVIVDGRNHYPQDIEATVQEAHPAVVPDRVAAFAVDLGDREAVVVVAECLPARLPDEQRAAITTAVRTAVTAAHEIRLHDVVLVRPGRLVRTSSGKVARAATRAVHRDGGYRP